MKKYLNPYELTITLFYVMTVISVCLMWYNNDLVWLLAVPVAGWVNHFFFSLNHRMISHRAFEARNKFIHNLIIVMNVFQVSHSPLRFAMVHRHHHSHADVPGSDIHGPTQGFWESVVGWEYHLGESVKQHRIKIPKDLLRDKFLVWFDTHYYKILILTCVATYLISWQAFWYVLVPGSVWFKLSANYLTNYHTSHFGYTNHDIGKDTAKNSIFANIFNCGEGWHNNHHANPGAWRYGEKWWEWDPPGFVIKHFLKKRIAQ